VEQLIYLDKHIFLYLNNLGNSGWDGFWKFISYKFTWIPFYALLLYLLFRSFGWKKTLMILVLTILMILVSDQMTNILKDCVKRLRPCFDSELEGLFRAIGCERRGQFGFTSAHAANHFAIAVFLGKIFKSKIKPVIWILLIWAALIAYSRIYLGVHFPLDIICGGIMGVLIGFGFLEIYKFSLKKFGLEV
jgi:undecaprenyl-diphosphatase